ncbi:MAG: hypothetical protein K2X29_02095 [Candidatus Obscuribacterales bacterium]|jgi:hypothetical protein|nr:hypothetical protein [Candidatus Obscuribacterales bacterium]
MKNAFLGLAATAVIVVGSPVWAHGAGSDEQSNVDHLAAEGAITPGQHQMIDQQVAVQHGTVGNYSGYGNGYYQGAGGLSSALNRLLGNGYGANTYANGYGQHQMIDQQMAAQHAALGNYSGYGNAYYPANGMGAYGYGASGYFSSTSGYGWNSHWQKDRAFRNERRQVDQMAHAGMISRGEHHQLDDQRKWQHRMSHY